MIPQITDNLDKELEQIEDDRTEAQKQIDANVKWRQGKRRFQMYIDDSMGMLLKHVLVARNLTIAEWMIPFIIAECKVLNIPIPEDPTKTQDA